MSLPKGTRLGGWRDDLCVELPPCWHCVCVHICVDLHKRRTEPVSPAAGDSMNNLNAGVRRRCVASHPPPAVPHQQWGGVGAGGQTHCQPGPDPEFCRGVWAQKCQAWPQFRPGRGTVGGSWHDRVWECRASGHAHHCGCRNQQRAGQVWAWAVSWLQPVWAALSPDGRAQLKSGRDELLPPSDPELQGHVRKVGCRPPSHCSMEVLDTLPHSLLLPPASRFFSLPRNKLNGHY